MQATVGCDTPLAIVDTPGLDDSRRTDTEVLTEITSFLTAQYQLGIRLRGVIYLHRITDVKMQGSTLRNFEMFRRICGEKALKNVVLLTTMWDKLTDRVEGLDRDQQLRQDFWSLMEANGSYIASFDGSREMAEAVLTRLLAKDEVILDIQRELHDERRTLADTSAGQLMVPAMRTSLEESSGKLRRLEARIREAEMERDATRAAAYEMQRKAVARERKRSEKDRERLGARIAEETREKIANERKKSKWVGSLQLFASVTGLALSVVFNVLPVLGVAI